MPEQIELGGKVAIITGASRGIGRAVAELFASSGATLILNGQQRDEATEAWTRAVSEAHAVPVTWLEGDISKSETSASLVKIAYEKHRRLDIYVNNAGVLIDGLIGMVPDRHLHRTIDVNLTGVLFGIQAAARLMKRGGGGSIVNMSSIIGRFGNKGQLVYAASKAGVIGATLAAAKELAPDKIRVNAIAPGFIDTDMSRQISKDHYRERIASIGLGRIGQPDDIAKVVLFLASDLSSYVTGQVIGVDGGMLI